VRIQEEFELKAKKIKQYLFAQIWLKLALIKI